MTEHTSDTRSTSPSLEFWFEFASTYSYLSVMRIEEAAARWQVTVRWRPFLLGPIFRSMGLRTSPFLLNPAKGEYMWRDMARQCHKHGLAWQQPSAFPRSALLPLRVALVGADQPWIGDFCRRVMTLNFVEDRDIDSPDVVHEVLASLGVPAQPLIELAQSEPNKVALREQTEIAQARGVFGAPTCFVGSEMFWGDDRLDDALAWAASNGGSDVR